MENQLFKGYKVFVTGGACGIGKGIVKAFYQAGATVAYCDLNEPEGLTLQKELNDQVLFFRTDVSKEKELMRTMHTLFGQWGDVDILINNVGISEFSPLVKTSVEQFDKVLATNLRPVFITSQALAVHRNSAEGKKRYGRIINIASTRYLQSEPGSEGYAASKGGIVSLTHALAISFSDYAITVNCISPGWIQNINYDQLSATDHLQHPSGRVGYPDDIANACLFLATPGNDFINGQNITIDGGMTKKMIYEE